MSQDTNVKKLIINKLTKAQYESIVNPDPTQLYFITDEVISSSDVVNALGFTPYNASNPAGYTNNVGTVTSVNNIQPDTNGNVTITIPDTATWGNITGTLADQTDLQNALDDKYDASNPDGFISGITDSMITTALGYTPYNATNPNNYITASALTGYATETWVSNQNYVNSTTLATTLLDYVTNTSLATTLADYQPLLVSGTNIKTLNGNSILGSGNLTLDGLPSQTGQNGKFLTTNGTEASWGNLPVATASTVGVVKPDNASIRVDNDGTLSAICRNVGEIITSSLPLTDAGLHLLDGSLLPYGIYKEFIDYIADLYTENPTANYFTTEALWQQSVTTYGVCGKFVYDSTNNTVRLPKVTGKIDGTTDINALGDLEPLFVRLPNITGSSGDFNGGNDVVSYGAMYSTKTGNTYQHSGGAGPQWSRIYIDASRSSSVYSGNGSDTAIHEQAIKCFIYIVIANSTKTDIQVDIDEVATDLNNKVGKNGDSVNGTYYATTEGTVLVVNNTNITDSTGTPTASAYSGIQFNDANNVRYGKLEGSWHTGGYTSFGFNASRNVNGSNVYAQVNAWVDANGNTYFNFPKCTTKATTTSSASNNKVAVVTQNYVNGTSWYRVYSDGWCEQGGFNANYVGTITLLKKMSNNTYTCLCCHNGSSAKGEGVIHAYNKTTTSFNVGLSISTSGMYGYSWYVSGYIN